MKLCKIIILSMFFSLVLYLNKEYIPQSTELAALHFLTSTGIDIKDGECSITYIKEDIKKDDKNGEKDEQANDEIITVKSSTLSGLYFKLQSMTDKIIKGSHISSLLIGEDTLKENFDYLMEYLLHNNDIRYDVKVFTVKDMSTHDFFEKVDKSDYDTKLQDLIKNERYISFYEKKELTDMFNIYYSDDKNGLIPALELKEDKFQFYGMGIIKDGKLADYIKYEMMRAYVLLKNIPKLSNIEITGNGNKYVFKIVSAKSKRNFDFKGERLNKIRIDAELNLNYEESRQKTNDIDFDKLKEEVNSAVEKEIRDLLEFSKEINTDIIGFNSDFEITHPYKWKKYKDIWNDSYKDVMFEVNVKSNIIKIMQ